MERDGYGVPPPEVDDVPISEEPLVDLLIVDVCTVGRIPIDHQHLPVDRDNLGVKTRNLRILQYDLTNRRLPADPDAGAAKAEFLTGTIAVENREFAEKARVRCRHGLAAVRRDHDLDRRRLRDIREAVAAVADDHER